MAGFRFSDCPSPLNVLNYPGFPNRVLQGLLRGAYPDDPHVLVDDYGWADLEPVLFCFVSRTLDYLDFDLVAIFLLDLFN
jgi:hypothetical protein